MMGFRIHRRGRVFLWSTAMCGLTLGVLLPVWAEKDGGDEGHGIIRFAEKKTSVYEHSNVATINVKRSKGSHGAVAVHYRTGADGTATAGQDYFPTSGVLEWGPEDTSERTLRVTVIDDLDPEKNETVLLELTAPTGGAVLAAAWSTTTLRIVDNDAADNDGDSDSEDSDEDSDSEEDSDGDSDDDSENGCCEGQVTELTLRYNGLERVDIQVQQKIKGQHTEIFTGSVAPGETFTIVGMNGKGTLGSKIDIFIDDALHTQIHTSCSQPVGPGLVRGDFEVVEGMSRAGGPLCPVDGEPPSDGCDECEGQVTELTLAYGGDLEMPLVQVFQKIKGKEVEIFNDTVTGDQPFTVYGGNGKGTLGSKIRFLVDGAENARIHTSCSEPVGPGLTAGDFEVLAGESRKGGRLCPVDENGSPGPDCDECEGQVTTLTLRYLGTEQAQVQVTQKIKGEEVMIFDEPIDPQGPFTIDGTNHKGTLGSKIRIYVDGELDATFHTSCSEPIGPGLVQGQFQVEDGFSRKGGRLCPIPEDDE